ncbi:MAG: MBL fold metallo-hydrolase [Selenomonadaceae bacterium]|nr:MBL fold metallo-hydrolase [Selenomonadaceae bacterium]
MNIYYLLNSGFLIQDERTLMIFDDYEDPEGIIDAAYDKGEFDKLYIFVTHSHFDHFGTRIRAYAPKVEKYIFSSDIKRTKRVKLFPTPKIVYMKRYTNWEDDTIKVKTFDSTDVGVSFLVETPSGKKIFHAGDFNWWHWEDDTLQNIELAEKVFKRQMQRITGLEADLAFFPVDGRLGSSQEKGAIHFISRTKFKGFVAMHRADYPLWKPSREFCNASKNIPVWAPVKPGEHRSFDGIRFY